jgi:hypothetical protein
MDYIVQPPISASLASCCVPGYWLPAVSIHVGNPLTPASRHVCLWASQSTYVTVANASPKSAFWFLQWPHHSVPYMITPLSVRHRARAVVSATSTATGAESSTCAVSPAGCVPGTVPSAAGALLFQQPTRSKDATKSVNKVSFFIANRKTKKVVIFYVFFVLFQ